MVIPKESSWFGSYAPPPPDPESAPGNANAMRYDPDFGDSRTAPEIVPMRMHPMYVEDWFGLRELDERGGVSMEICEQRHMHLPPECWEGLVKRFIGGGWEADATTSFREQTFMV